MFLFTFYGSGEEFFLSWNFLSSTFVYQEKTEQQSVKTSFSPSKSISKSISSEIYVETVTHISADITEVISKLSHEYRPHTGFDLES